MKNSIYFNKLKKNWKFIYLDIIKPVNNYNCNYIVIYNKVSIIDKNRYEIFLQKLLPKI